VELITYTVNQLIEKLISFQTNSQRHAGKEIRTYLCKLSRILLRRISELMKGTNSAAPGINDGAISA
jgi:hypothetical protein